MTALIGRSGLTPTAYAATAFHATLYAQRGGNYNSSVFNGSRSVILQTYNGGNAVSGDNNGGTGGGVIAVVGVGGPRLDQVLMVLMVISKSRRTPGRLTFLR